jgi:predicted metal-dependent peptidase
LAAFSLGVALTQRCTLRAVAEALARWGKPDTVERRLPRFLPHPRLDWQACLLAFAAWEELALRDFKSTGWQWQRSHVRTLGAANRLWLVRATAYA